MTAAEWDLLRSAWAALAPHVRDDVTRRTLGARSEGPVVCPFLDETEGSCRAYEARPIACRTYGFYTEWDAGLHCNLVTEAVREHAAEDRVVWGNGEAIAADMKPLGPVKSLDAWMREDAPSPSSPRCRT